MTDDEARAAAAVERTLAAVVGLGRVLERRRERLDAPQRAAERERPRVATEPVEGEA